MCGRYAASRNPDDLVEEFEVEWVETVERFEPDYNVAPTKPVPAVMVRGGQRQLRLLRWGLVPPWAADPSIGGRLVNARVETVADKPAFRRAMAARRCLLPADGYYEWYGEERGGKQPFFIRPRDGGVLAMGGLYELWRDPALAPDDPAAWLWSCAVLTTAAEDALGHLHDRMPLLVERDRWAAWLDPRSSDAHDLQRLLVAAVAGRLEAYQVSPDVGDVRNNGPHLAEPLQAGARPMGLTALPRPDASDELTLF